MGGLRPGTGDETDLPEAFLSLSGALLSFGLHPLDHPASNRGDELQNLLNKDGLPYFEAVAMTGPGVFETLKDLAKRVIEEIKQNY